MLMTSRVMVKNVEPKHLWMSLRKPLVVVGWDSAQLNVVGRDACKERISASRQTWATELAS